jgi:predicted PurR-regulated permease PerM
MNAPTPKQAHIIWGALTGLAVAIVIALIVAAVWGLGQVLDLLSPVIWPLAIAGVVACVLSPVVDALEKRWLSRVKAILLVFVVAFLIVAGTLASVIPQVVVETRELAKKIPEYSQKLQDRFNRFIAAPPEIIQRLLPHHFADLASAPVIFTTTNATGPQDNNVNNAPNTTPISAVNSNSPSLSSAAGMFKDALPRVTSWIFKQGGKVLSGFGMLAGLALIPVYAFYFLLEKKGIQTRWRDYLPLRDSQAKEEVVFVLESISQYLVAFFRGQVLVAICDAVLYTIGFLALDLNYAFLLGFAAALLTMIPFLGAMVICVAALTLAFVQYTDWTHPLLVLGVFAIVQTLEGLVISPKIIGDRVGLPPVIIIIAVMVGTTLLGGILGGVLAIPLAAALRVIMLRYVWRKSPVVA